MKHIMILDMFEFTVDDLGNNKFSEKDKKVLDVWLKLHKRVKAYVGIDQQGNAHIIDFSLCSLLAPENK